MKFRPLSAEETTALKTARNLAIKLMNTSASFTPRDLQRAYDDVVENNHEHSAFQIALGVAFGDLVKSENDYQWTRVADEYGEENALSPRNVDVACFPISIIQKRLMARDRIDIEHLVSQTIVAVETMRTSGKYRKT